MIHRRPSCLLLVAFIIGAWATSSSTSNKKNGWVSAFQPSSGALAGFTGNPATRLLGFVSKQQQQQQRPRGSATTTTVVLHGHRKDQESETKSPSVFSPRPAFLETFARATQTNVVTTLLGLAIFVGGVTGPALTLSPSPAWAATDPSQIVGCLFQKCSVQLGKCILNPKCLANVVCINTCTGRPDEIGCQIKCGDIFENEVVGEFNSTLLLLFLFVWFIMFDCLVWYHT